MTVQASDSVRYKRKTFKLIDCTSNLIASANFEIEGSSVLCTSCYRGYTAEYHIRKGILYGIKCITDLIRTDEKISIKERKSDCLRMNFTGSILIAEGCLDSDFIDSYLFADTAYELRFENGVLQEENSLDEVIEKWKEIEIQIDKGNDEKIIQGIYKDEYEGYSRKVDIREKFAEEHLKYKYCRYKWLTKG